MPGSGPKGLPVATLNPRQVRQFAQSMGLQEKTDALDAGIIAGFTEVRKSALTQPVAASQQRLRGLVTHLSQLNPMSGVWRAPAPNEVARQGSGSASLHAARCAQVLSHLKGGQ